MDSYREYPVRCPTCGGQLACFSKLFETLIENDTIENALNLLGIDDYCCRMLMINPVIVFFNMENRELIEGFKGIDQVNDDDSQKESTSIPIYTPCLSEETKPSISLTLLSKPNLSIAHPIIPDIGMKSSSMGEPISLEEKLPENFVEPELVGVPTINRNILKELDKIYVGAKKKTQVLNGRTYLAR